MSNDRLLTSITKLNGENYHDWKFAVSIVLRQKGCWKVTSGEEEKPSGEAEKSWEIKAEERFTLIALTVEASQYTYIRDAKNGPEAWKALKDIYEKNSRSMRINLKRQFYGFEHDTSTSISAYSVLHVRLHNKSNENLFVHVMCDLGCLGVTALNLD
jgi:ABC-type molybdate transport system ATPase subunit